MVANTPEERCELEMRAPGDIDEEIRRVFSNDRPRTLSALALSNLGAWFGDWYGKPNSHPRLEDREEIYKRKHKNKMWVRREEEADGSSSA